MAQQTRATNKALFETGDKPDGSNYADLIDSFLSLADTGAQTVTSPVSFSGAISVASGVSANTVEASTASITGTVSAHHVHASSATFIGNVAVSGKVDGSTASFVGRVSANTGIVLLVTRATIIQSHTAAAPLSVKLPNGSDIIDFKIDVEQPFETAAGATAVAVRASGANALTFFEIPVSASGRYDLGNTTTRGRAFRNVSATIEAHVSVQGSNTAMSAGQAILSVIYV